MQIKNNITIYLSGSDLKQLVVEYVKSKTGYDVTTDDVHFQIGTEWRGYGLGEYEELVFKRCTVDCREK